MFSLPIPQILVSLHNDINNNNNNNNNNTSPPTSPTNLGARITSTLQKMGTNISVAADELSEELSALLEATSLASASTREELYSFFDDGFDDDAEEMSGGTSGARTPSAAAVMVRESHTPQGYFALATSAKFEGEVLQCRQRSGWNCRRDFDGGDQFLDLMTMDEGYHSSSSSSGDLEMEFGEEEEREALLPAKRFSWRASSPERCSLLYYGK